MPKKPPRLKIGDHVTIGADVELVIGDTVAVTLDGGRQRVSLHKSHLDYEGDIRQAQRCTLKGTVTLLVGSEDFPLIAMQIEGLSYRVTVGQEDVTKV